MKHYYSALILTFFMMNASESNLRAQNFDWQGHRGCRGLMPENTIPAFLKALDFPEIKTLELDLAVSKNGELIVSHEPWMSEITCTKPDGTPVAKSEAMALKIMGLTYEEVKQFDCGSRGNPRFPNQQAMKVYKPSLEDVVTAVRQHCEEKSMKMPHFNIEIKSHPDGDGLFTPKIEDFTKLVLAELERLKITELTCVQSFDTRALVWVKKLAPNQTIAFLVENKDGYEKNLKLLDFQPTIYSVDYNLLRKRDVKALHKLGIKVIPWTVNNIKSMKKLRRWGVDGIITDYPNLIAEVEN
ncbi:MAG: glycerophosphodiester phosphodiesterase [Bacteroidetes bacterium]|nr:glycerophosphodiester phosphodiesterase [Bacteroidota bacterium]